ncbi:MAG: flagellar biosynthesis anti-sigma factor FlgM [Sphingobium sp.]
MIKPVGQAMSAAIEATTKVREIAPVRSVAPKTAAPVDKPLQTPAARLASEGAPVDLEKVARIKAAIASGNYPVDANRIADRMVELDLPRSIN